MDADQTSYAGFVDGEHWATLIGCFEEWAERHRQPHAVVTARRMAETADDIPNDLEHGHDQIVEAEYDEQFDRDGVIYSENICVWQTFDVCVSGSLRGISRRTPWGSSEISLRGSLVTAHKQTSR